MIDEQNFYLELSSGKRLQFASPKKNKIKIEKRQQFPDETNYPFKAGSKERIALYAAKIALGEKLFE